MWYKTYAWDREFESHRVHEDSSLVVIVCCVGIGLCDGLIARSEEAYRVCVSNLRHLGGGLGPICVVAPKQQKIVNYSLRYSKLTVTKQRNTLHKYSGPSVIRTPCGPNNFGQTMAQYSPL